ncbi:MAG: dihydrolipoyl dehydrogenase family protein [Nitrososphaeraceae archaeon]
MEKSTSTFFYDLVIIGTGVAASTVAYECNSVGWKIAIIDSRPFGGTCALRGCDPKKVLIAAEEAIDWNIRMKGKGIDSKNSSNNFNINWSDLVTFKKTFTDPVPKHSEEEFLKAGIATYHGLAQFVGKNKIKLKNHNIKKENDNQENDFELIEGKFFVIASGAKPRPLNIDGEQLITTSDQFLELTSLPKNIVFIGGGYISFEFAYVAAHAGSKVTILHRSNKPLDTFDPDLVTKLLEKSKHMGIDILLGKEVIKVEERKNNNGSSNKLIVHYNARSTDSSSSSSSSSSSPSTNNNEHITNRPETKNNTNNIEADIVVHGAGRIPQIDELNLESAGIEYDIKNGIKVNEYLQSVSNPNVYAAGDTTLNLGGPPLTPIGIYEGRIVSYNLLNDYNKKMRANVKKEKPDYKGVSSVVFTVPPIASVGISEHEAKEKGLQFKTVYQDTSNWFSSKRIGEQYSGFKIITDEKTDKILGAHIMGPHAEEIINIFALAIRLDISKKALKDSAALFTYPTNSSDIVYML